MKTAKIFQNGRSQAVRLPKEYQFEDSEVYVNKIGRVVVLLPKDARWESMLAGLSMFSDDFMENRDQPAAPEERPPL